MQDTAGSAIGLHPQGVYGASNLSVSIIMHYEARVNGSRLSQMFARWSQVIVTVSLAGPIAQQSEFRHLHTGCKPLLRRTCSADIVATGYVTVALSKYTKATSLSTVPYGGVICSRRVIMHKSSESR